MEKKLFICESQRGRYFVKIGATDAAAPNLDEPGVVLSRSHPERLPKPGCAADLARQGADRAAAATANTWRRWLRREDSCWIRGSTDHDLVFLLDTRAPSARQTQIRGKLLQQGAPLHLSSRPGDYRVLRAD